MPSDSLHVRIPGKLKRTVQKVLEANGMDVSSAIRLFFTHVAVRGTVPLPWLTANGFTPELEERLLKQIRKGDIVKKLKTSEDIEKFIDDL